MTTTPDTTTEFADRLLAATLGSQLLTAVYLGERLGWYQALAQAGPLTSTELAQRTGTQERYAREWLEHQAVTGVLTVEDGSFRLPPAHAEVLLDGESLAYLSPLARLQAAVGANLQHLVEAYRNGGGVSWAQLGEDARKAQALLNRPMFLHQLAQEYLPAVPDLHQRLQAGARVADLGCGEGWSSIGLAQGYPLTQVDGLDVDGPSIDAARRNAAASDVQDRVRFVQVDASQPDGGQTGAYDAVFAFECVHDTGNPVGFLTTMNRLAAPDGVVVVVDERTEDTLTVGSPLEQLLYGFSLTVCLPDGLSHPGGAGTGTVMRPATLATYAAEAGFSRVEALPIEHDMLRFYRLYR